MWEDTEDWERVVAGIDEKFAGDCSAVNRVPQKNALYEEACTVFYLSYEYCWRNNNEQVYI